MRPEALSHPFSLYRNDIVAFACERLPGPALSRFLGYVEVVDCMGEVSCALSTLPPPYGCIHSSMHEAEALAWPL